MDSLSSLNTSLPRSFPRRHELHQAFKAAALSVAQLYKTAAAEEDVVRAAGYQDALEDILAFLDHENLGLGDGEGWKVRRWATERLSQSAYGSESEDDGARKEDIRPTKVVAPCFDGRIEDEVSSRTVPPHVTSPRTQRKSSHHTSATSSRHAESTSATQPKEDVFQFRSPHDDIEIDQSSPAHAYTSRSSNTRPTSQNMRGGNPSIALGTLGNGGGQKRKSTFSDFLDLSDVGNGPGGGHKRGKLS
jgi:hypothetical protein